MNQSGLTRIAMALEYPLMQAGGTEGIVRELLPDLSSKYEVVLVSGDKNKNDLPSEFSRMIRAHASWQAWPGTKQAARSLAEWLTKQGVQLAHFHFGGDFSWCNRWPSHCPVPGVARSGIPVVTTVHLVTGPLNGVYGPDRPLLLRLAAAPIGWFGRIRVLRHVRREMAVSIHDCKRLRRLYWPMRARFGHIYHSRIRGRSPIPNSEGRQHTILCVGHIAQRKGQVILAQAFAQISARFPDWKLCFAGHLAEESCRKPLEEAAAKCAGPDRIGLLGQRRDVAALMASAAIYVQPSFAEGLPLGLQEAMYLGCACVATRIPGNAELIEPQPTSNVCQSGLLIPPGDVKALADALASLMDSETLRRALGQNAHGTIEPRQMTAEHMVRNYEELYESIAAGR